MSDKPPSTLDVPAFVRTRDHLRYALNAAFFAFEDVVKASKEYFDTLDPAINQGIALPSALPVNFLTSQERKRKRTPSADYDPENPPPKRAMTPFFIFLNRNRQRIRHELTSRNEPASITRVSEEATRQWRALDAGERAKYDEEYKANFGEYKEQLKEWKQGKNVKKSIEVSSAASVASENEKPEKAAAATDRVPAVAPPVVVATTAETTTPLTEKKKKHKKDKSNKKRSPEKHKEKHSHAIDPLATPTPASKTPLSKLMAPPLISTPKTDKHEKKSHGDKEKKTPRSERRREKRRQRESELWKNGVFNGANA